MTRHRVFSARRASRAPDAAPRRRIRVSGGGRLWTAAVVVACFGLTGCTQSGGDNATPAAGATSVAGPTGAATGGTTPNGATTGTTGTTGSPAADDATGTPAPPLPNPVTTTPTKAVRAGQTQSPSVSAPAVGFTSSASYSDKVSVAIVKATNQVETGHGPGVMTGREFVTLDVELTNGSSEPIDLNQVVVTTYYGAGKQLAPPVYTPTAGTRDFSGTVNPGAKASAVLGVAVPASERGNVTMIVDFDAKHSSATFTGALP